MQTIKAQFKKVLNNDQVKRVGHTFWQAALGALVASHFNTSADVKASLTIAIASGLAAVKALILSKQG